MQKRNISGAVLVSLALAGMLILGIAAGAQT